MQLALAAIVECREFTCLTYSDEDESIVQADQYVEAGREPLFENTRRFSHSLSLHLRL